MTVDDMADKNAEGVLKWEDMKVPSTDGREGRE